MWQVIEWDLPVGQGGARAETERYAILRYLTEHSQRHGYKWQTLTTGPRWRLRIIIEDRDLAMLALTWPTTDLQWRRVGVH